MTTVKNGMDTLQGVVKILEEADLEYVFGMPGGYMGKLYDGLLESNLKPILVRHEQIGSIMAETYGRLTGKPGVFTAQGAWTVSNGMMGLIEGVQGASPMLVLTDMTDNAPYSHHGSYQVGTGEYGGYDVKKAIESSTKYSTVVNHPNQAIQSVQLAIKHATDRNPGPSAVVFHSAAINGDVEPEGSPTIYHTDNYLFKSSYKQDEKDLVNVLEILKEAKTPFIIAGNGVKVADAYKEVEKFSDLTGIPVGTTAQGKSAIRENHPNAVGVIGNWGQESGNNLLGQADVILVLGSKLAPTDTCNHAKELIDPERQKIIQVDIETKNSSWTVPVDIPVIGDVKNVLEQMIDLINEREELVDENEINNRARFIKEVKKEYNYMYAPEMESENTPLKPQRVVKELNEYSDENTLITLDAGENRVFMVHYFETKSSGSILMPGSAGGMGYALPSALAAKLVYPNKTVIAFAGDGGFAMTMNGLLTAVQYNIPVICIVLNNSSLGWVKNAQDEEKIASEFVETDFSAIAQSMGCFGTIVKKPGELKNALNQAKESGKPAVIDIRSTDTESYKKVMSKLAKSLED